MADYLSRHPSMQLVTNVDEEAERYVNLLFGTVERIHVASVYRGIHVLHGLLFELELESVFMKLLLETYTKGASRSRTVCQVGPNCEDLNPQG